MSPRDYALAQLDEKHLPGWPANLLRRHGAAPPTDPRDRALAERLVVGVIKNQIHLRHLLIHYSGRALKSIDPLAQKVLAMALYQLRFMSRIPAPAAVNEAVNQAKRIGRGKAAGFINAVLRNAVSRPAPELPDRDRAPADYAERVLSHPRELFARLAELMGEADALRFCEHDNAEPPTIVRLFTGASEADLAAPGVTIQPHRRAGMYIVEPAKVALLADWSARGIAQAQDPTAAAVVPELGIQPGETVLDRCAGLGTKTLQIYEGTGPAGKIVAMDPSEIRCRTLRSLLAQRGITSVAARQAGMLAELAPDDPKVFDRILVDAPCSNSGVLARRPEARYAQGRDALASLLKLQSRILEDAAGALRPGGTLVYSTCSIWPEENQRQVAHFLTSHPQYRLLRDQVTLPGLEDNPEAYCDGGYFAVLTSAT